MRKKNIKKKMLSILMVASMVGSMIPFSLAENELFPEFDSLPPELSNQSCSTEEAFELIEAETLPEFTETIPEFTETIPTEPESEEAEPAPEPAAGEQPDFQPVRMFHYDNTSVSTLYASAGGLEEPEFARLTGIEDWTDYSYRLYDLYLQDAAGAGVSGSGGVRINPGFANKADEMRVFLIQEELCEEDDPEDPDGDGRKTVSYEAETEFDRETQEVKFYADSLPSKWLFVGEPDKWVKLQSRINQLPDASAIGDAGQALELERELLSIDAEADKLRAEGESDVEIFDRLEWGRYNVLRELVGGFRKNEKLLAVNAAIAELPEAAEISDKEQADTLSAQLAAIDALVSELRNYGMSEEELEICISQDKLTAAREALEAYNAVLKEQEEPEEGPGKEILLTAAADNVLITLTAEAGAFGEVPAEELELCVRKIEEEQAEETGKIEEALSEKRGADVTVASSYKFDITVLDGEGHELQPAEGARVKVSFALAEAADGPMKIDVYHIRETEGTNLTAESLEAQQEAELSEEESGKTVVTVETDGFSYYVVEFTYETLQYVLSGGESVKLSEIQRLLEVPGTVAAAAGSNSNLFTVEKDAEGEDWTVTSLQPFQTEEWLKITVNGSEYTIVVTDDVYDTLDADLAYIYTFEVEKIHDGTGSWDTEASIAGCIDPTTGAAQTLDSRGNDANDSNGKVRTYDSVNYDLKYETLLYNTSDKIKTGNMNFRFVLPLTADQAEWDLESMAWMSGEAVTEEEIGGVQCQVLTGTRLLVPTEGNDSAFPGSGTLSAAVKVLTMKHGDAVKPVFYAWLDKNDIDAKNPAHACAEHNRAELACAEADPVTVTASPKYNVQLKQGNTSSNYAKGTFDFSTGDDTAMDKAAGRVEGRLTAYGITLQLYNDRADKGIMGIELPSGPITFDVTLGNSFLPNGGTEKDVTETYTPLVWTYGPLGSYATVNGRDNKVNGNIPFADLVGPMNSGGGVVTTAGSSRCYNGGNWSLVKNGNTLSFTVSDYLFDIRKFPNTDYGNTAFSATYYNPANGGYLGLKNIGCFSAGQFMLVTPFYNSTTGKYVLEEFGVTEGDFYTTVSDGKLRAQSVSGQSLAAASDNGNQPMRTDDTVKAQVNLSRPASFYNIILWSNRESVYWYDVFGGLTYYINGQDWAQEGQELALTWGFSNNNGGDWENNMIAAESLMKFDPAGVDLTGDVRFRNPLTDYGQSGTVLFAAKPDGSAWSDDAELKAAKMEDLVYYESLDALQAAGKICVGALYEIRPTGKAEDVTPFDRGRPIASVWATVKSGAVRNETYMCTVENKIWRLNDYNSAGTVPSLLENDPSSPITLPKESVYSHPDYTKAYYDASGYAGGHNGTYTHGDSLLVLGLKATIEKQVAQQTGGKPKQLYDMDYSQRTADYVLRPRLEAGNGRTAGDVITNVTVTDTLPAALSYISGSAAVGGTYVQAQQEGRQGRVEGGTQKEPDIRTNADGSRTLIWRFDNVSLNELTDGFLPEIHFSAAIGDPNDQKKDVTNNQLITNNATVRADKDLRDISAFNANTSDAQIRIIKLVSNSISKQTEEKYIETGDAMSYTLVSSNNSENLMKDLIILDTLPYNGDSAGSSFAGTLKVSGYTFESSDLDNLADWKVYYTTDTAARGTISSDYTKADIEAGSSTVTGGTVNWTEASIDPTDGTVAELNGKAPTAIAAIGDINVKKLFRAKLTLTNDSMKEKDIYANTMSQGNAQTTAVVSVISRALEGLMWNDKNQNGQRDTGEAIFKGIKVTLMVQDADGSYTAYKDANGNPVQCTPGKVKDILSGTETDGEDGHYMFTNLPAGTFGVRFEGNTDSISEFIATEQKKSGIAEDVNSDAYGKMNTAGDQLLYTQIEGIKMPTKAEIIAADNGCIYISRYNDSGIYKDTLSFSFMKIIGSDITKPLPGAEFALYACTKEGDPAHTAHSDPRAAGGCWDTANAKTARSGEDGIVEFEDLVKGTYCLVETKAPAGYRLPTGYWIVTVNTVTGITAAETAETPPAFIEKNGKKYLPNYEKFVMPDSGSSSGTLFLFAGTLLTCLALLTLVNMRSKRRMRKYY